MGLSVDKIKKQLANMEGGPGRKTIWKPKDEHTVRCLDVPDSDEFGREVGYHYGVDDGKKMYCPATDGEECPFCDLAESLKAWKDENGNDKPEAVRKQDFEWYKKIQRAVKHYVPMVERMSDGNESAPLWWEMSPRTYSELLKICINDDWNEDHPDGGGSKVLTSTTSGLDIVVSLKKAGQKGNKTNFDLTDVEERKKFSVLTKNGNAKSILERIPAFDTVAKPVSSEDAKTVFAKFEGSLSSGKLPDGGGKDGLEYASNNTEKLDGNSSVDDVMAKLKGIVEKKG